MSEFYIGAFDSTNYTYFDQTLIAFGIDFYWINHTAQFIYDAHVTIKQFHLFQVTEKHCRIRFNRAKRFE